MTVTLSNKFLIDEGRLEAAEHDLSPKGRSKTQVTAASWQQVIGISRRLANSGSMEVRPSDALMSPESLGGRTWEGQPACQYGGNADDPSWAVWYGFEEATTSRLEWRSRTSGTKITATRLAVDWWEVQYTPTSVQSEVYWGLFREVASKN